MREPGEEVGNEDRQKWQPDPIGPFDHCQEYAFALNGIRRHWRVWGKGVT